MEERKQKAQELDPELLEKVSGGIVRECTCGYCGAVFYTWGTLRAHERDVHESKVSYSPPTPPTPEPPNPPAVP